MMQSTKKLQGKLSMHGGILQGIVGIDYITPITGTDRCYNLVQHDGYQSPGSYDPSADSMLVLETDM